MKYMEKLQIEKVVNMNRFEKIKDYLNTYMEGKSSQLLMFYAMVVIEVLAMFIIALLQIAMDFETDSIIPMLVSVVYLLIILCIASRHPNNLMLYKALTILPMLLIVIPYLYMGTGGGGIKSGMPVWMVLGLLMIFLFSKGIHFIVLFAITLSVYLGCIIYTYMFMQEQLGNLPDLYYYQDNIMAIVAVSVSCGMIIKYHQRVEERSKQKIEQEKLNAQKANEAKTKFLMSMSHDIRTPMNAIIGMTELANYHIDDKEKVQDCLKKISDSSSMLLYLINNVLDMSEIENGELKLKDSSFELKEVVEKIYVVLEQNALAKGISFVVDCKDIQHNKLIGDAVRLRQVLMNLLSNSLKFTPSGGLVTLRVKEEDSNENGYAAFLIEVKDTGIGMKQEFIDKMIFKPFERGEAGTARRTEGNGIGMSITKNILDVMGADLHIESEVGKGSKFSIHAKLKIDEESAYEEQEQASKVPNLAGKKLLVVEDNLVNMEIIVSILERTQVGITKAWNAEEALKIYEESEEGYFDLILFDVMLPGMNGDEAVKVLRGMDRKDALEIPIFAMTANAFAEDVENSLRSGMNEHLSKPVDIDTLFKKLHEYLC